MRYPVTPWLQRHRTLARLVSRGPVRAWIGRRVWAEAAADPVFRAGIEQGKADYAAGRFYHYETETGEATPNPDWPKDGPQPEV